MMNGNEGILGMADKSQPGGLDDGRSQPGGLRDDGGQPGGLCDNHGGSKVVWNCFDPEADFAISARTRPHWDQSGAVTFVTIRLIDSMPKSIVESWIRAQQDWLAKHQLKDLDINAMLERTDLPRNLRRAFIKFRNRLWNENLDQCHGSCCLADHGNAEIVAKTLLHFNGQRYDMERFVIMPNHIHILVQMRHGWNLRMQCQSWMQYSATRINRRMKTSGHFWAEPFDHVVRNPFQFDYLRQYIVDNPRKANLQTSDALLWLCHIGPRTLDAD
jgi:REP element-mobilizing transposase RayT